ncbi:MAG: hypothetical protein FJ217_15150 [Ignavibacteria bacterium]|nr:hypothetical protein [Ignavibacteria bacterium]
MAKTAVRASRIVAISVAVVSSLSLYAQRLEDGRRNYYAAVFLNRGHVSGGASSNIGLFKRMSSDTIWHNIYRPNLFTFGIGFWERGATRRYYIAGGNGLHRSTDEGRTWRVLTTWKTEEILSVALDPVDSSILYVATPFGVFKSTDDGSHWVRKMKGMKRWYVQRLVVDRTDRRKLYAAAEDDLYQTTDGGEHWRQLGVGVPGILSALQHPQQTAVLLVGTEDHGVRVTTDGGRTWSGGQNLPQTSFYALRSSSDGQALYAGGYRTGLWKSENLGRTWSLVSPAPNVEAIYSIFVHPDDPKHLLIGTCGQGVYESFDGGGSWKNIGLQGAHVKQIELYP